MSQNVDKKNLYRLEGRVPLKDAIPLGMQHILAMYAGNLAPLLVVVGVINGNTDANLPLISLLQNAMFVSAFVTLVQLYRIWKIGSGLPTVMGTSSGFIPVGIAVGMSYGYGAVMGATLIGGIVEFALGFIIKPANPEFGSFTNLGIGLFVFIVIIALRQFKNEFISVSSILFGIIIGYIVAIFIGMVDFAPVANAGWFALPKPIFMIEEFNFEFRWEAIIQFLLVYLATTVETIGDNTGIAVGGLGRDITDDELQGAVFADGFGSSFASLFGVMPNTSFSQNVGIIGMTKVVNRFTLMTGAVFLMLCSFIPKLGALVATIPNPVLGGAVLLMFAMITMSGLNLLYQDGKITDRDMIIVAASLGVAFGLSNVPEVMRYLPEWFQNMFKQAIVGAFVTATILNLILPKNLAEEVIHEQIDEEIAKESN